LRSIWKGKLVLKGIQTVEDAVMAAEARVDGIILRYEYPTLFYTFSE
jgi:L-lactate dehydrogenase (cytochrome)